MKIVVNTSATQVISPAKSMSRPGRSYLPYRYSIDGILTIGSQVKLRELEYFRAQWVGNDTDLTIRVGPVRGNGPRTRAQMTQFMTPRRCSTRNTSVVWARTSGSTSATG